MFNYIIYLICFWRDVFFFAKRFLILLFKNKYVGFQFGLLTIQFLKMMLLAYLKAGLQAFQPYSVYMMSSESLYILL